ncbi:LysE family translocator [Isoalcanivorax beigongshangi]|uniref:LysE family translocator n=1 Tax=Isoalcanivorax beigongshangi TaxID=3238810 RepID=A0ABV4AKE8_9GAMM
MTALAAEFLKLALVHLLAVIAPGPDLAVTVRNSVRGGRRAGVFTALGIGAAMAVHASYAIAGLTLLQRHPTLLLAVQVLGIGYLLWLAWQLLRAQPAGPGAAPVTAAALSAAAAWRMGFLTNLLNPKAVLFFTALFTNLVSLTTPLWAKVGYGVWMCMVNALWFTLVAWLLSGAAQQALARHGYWVDRLMGLVLAWLAVAFALSLLR